MVLALSLLTASCARTVGWGVALWPPEGSALPYGAPVPVYFKSNISKTYAVGVPGAKAKEELQLWRLDFYKSARSARKAAEAFAPMAALFGIATRDGLLLRAEPTNAADQVYRLKLDQEVKLLAKVAGTELTTGGQALQGDWYLALADDGTRGYVFSNQLSIWNAAADPRPALAQGKPAMDAREADLFDKTWRPDYFKAMRDAGRVDLYAYQQRYGLFADLLRKQVRVERPGFSKVYDFTSIERREDGSFGLEPTGASFTFTTTGDLVFAPPPADLPPPPADGSPPVTGFVFNEQLDDPREVIAAEERRRMNLLSDLVKDGEQFQSDAYGALVITRSTRFTWAGHGALSPAIIPEDSGDTGSIAMDVFLSPALASAWTGAFTLRFDGGGLPARSFAYRFTASGLELAYIDQSLVKGAVADAPNGLTQTAYFYRYR